MRPRAARLTALHPVSLTALAASVLVVHRLVYAPHATALAAVASALACAAVAAAFFATVHFSTAGYDALADGVTLSWLENPSCDGQEDVILAARRRDVIVGALVLRLEPRSPAPAASAGPSHARAPHHHHHHHHHGRRKSRSRSAGLRGGKGVIRAWTTIGPHRGEGIGRELLRAAVRRTRQVCGRDAEVGFAREHANSPLLLPALFAAPFKRDERRAAMALDALVHEADPLRRKR